MRLGGDGGGDVLERTEPAQNAGDPAFEATSRRLVARLETRLRGRLGVMARHLPSGREIAVAADERYPMASTYKVPIAGALLSRIDRGEVSLSDMVAVSARHLAETGPIAQSVRHPGISLSVANLIELMLTQSNNNATDRVLEVAGGPAAVTRWIRSLGIDDISVDTDVNALLNRFYDFPDDTASFEHAKERFPTSAELEASSYRPRPAFDDDPRDSATPAAMVTLLERLFWSSALSIESRSFLLGVMERCETGFGRIRGLLPPGTPVADKTGTVGGTVNDVGTVELPDGRGTVVLAIMTKSSPLVPYSLREPVIAELARSIYEYFHWTTTALDQG